MCGLVDVAMGMNAGGGADAGAGAAKGLGVRTTTRGGTARSPHPTEPTTIAATRSVVRTVTAYGQTSALGQTEHMPAIADVNELPEDQDPFVTPAIRQAAVNAVPLGPSRAAVYAAYVANGVANIQEGMVTTVNALARRLTYHRRQGRRDGRDDAFRALEVVAASRGAAAATVIRNAVLEAKAALLAQAVTADPVP